LPGELARAEGQPPVRDTMVNEAYDHLGITYQFFWENYARDSIDDQGMPLKATVHYQKNYSNAFWNGKEMVIGDGDDEIFNRFTISTDIIAKELAKGVVEAEAKLPYWGESGSLIDSFSDVFGSLVKQYFLLQTASQADWLIGQGLFTTRVKGIALRSMKAPGTAYDDPVLGKDPQPAHMRDYVNTDSDSGGIHINSGIPNHAFYLIALELNGYAWEKAGRIWYATLKNKLQTDSTFEDCADLTYQTAGELFGTNSTEQQTVRKGWAEVGINVGSRAFARGKKKSK
jgi:Zn-dependent metalloprotease